MDTNIAISVKNVSKTFRIPHEKVSSLRGAFTQAFNGRRTYEEFKALDDVSFEVKKGEFLLFFVLLTRRIFHAILKVLKPPALIPARGHGGVFVF